jgi:hypothetical protein
VGIRRFRNSKTGGAKTLKSDTENPKSSGKVFENPEIAENPEVQRSIPKPEVQSPREAKT